MQGTRLLILCLALSAAPAFGSLLFTISPTVESGESIGCIDYSGGCVLFSGTLEDDGADDLYLNDTSVTFTAPGDTYLSSDPNYFLNNVSGLLCSASDPSCPFPTSYAGPIFQIDIA